MCESLSEVSIHFIQYWPKLLGGRALSTLQFFGGALVEESLNEWDISSCVAGKTPLYLC